MEPITQLHPCPQCGLRAIEFNLMLKFGCDHCCVHFQKETNEILEIMQGEIRHVGKIPNRFMPSLSVLQNRLKEAIIQERYEDAKLIQQQINKIK